MVVKRDITKIPVDTRAERSITDLLLEIEKTNREENHQYAHQLSIQATHLAPDNVEAWLWRLALAPSFEERVACMNRLNELEPNYRDRHNLAYFTQKELLDRDPFLAYLEETDDLYRVRNGRERLVSIRKKRTPESVPPQPSARLKAAYGWLMMAIVGLLSAGLGTFLFAPLAGFTAIQVGRQPRSRADWVNAIIVLSLSIFVFLLGLIFLFIFWLHWSG